MVSNFAILHSSAGLQNGLTTEFLKVNTNGVTVYMRFKTDKTQKFLLNFTDLHVCTFESMFLFFPGQDQYYRRLLLWICCPRSKRRLNQEVDFFFFFFLRILGSNLRPQVYKASGLSTAPRRLLKTYVSQAQVSDEIKLTQ